MEVRAIKVGSEYAIVDLEDYEKVRYHKWHYLNGYAYTRGEPMQMHILPRKEGCQIEHINGNRLDNRRVNLLYALVAKRKTVADILILINDLYKGKRVKDIIPDEVQLTNALIAQAERDAVTKRKVVSKIHRLRVVNDEGIRFDNMSDACRWVGTSPNNSNNILRAILAGREAYGYRWFLDSTKMSIKDLRKFYQQYNVTEGQVVYVD